MRSTSKTTQSADHDPGLSAALQRNPRDFLPTDEFEGLGVRVLGANLTRPDTTTDLLKLTGQHHSFLKSLSKQERAHYRIVLVPGSSSPKFFTELYGEYSKYVNQGDWAVAPSTPRRGYVQLLKLPNAAEARAHSSLQEIDASPQALIIGELSARLRRNTLLPSHDAYLKSALCKATGPARADSVKYLIGESVDGLLHVVIDDGGYRRVLAVKALECRA